MQVINADLQKKLNEYENDLIKLSKIRNELLEERDQFMREKLEIKALDDK